MALTAQENADLTKVGPGTPCGTLMRRYWHPIGFAAELKGKPVRRRLLGEDLVLFRDPNGKLGLIGARCPHRGTSLHLGYIEDGGLRCCYHGWLFDINGRCLEQPTEPAEANFKVKVHQPAYKVEDLAGVIFAYLGPEPAPLVPRYDVLVREDGVRSLQGRIVACNFLQMVENTVDQHHFKWLHRTETTKRWSNEVLNSEYFEYGIRDTFARTGGSERYQTVSYFIMPTMNKTGYHVPDGHPCSMAAAHPGYEALRWRVPADDTHTMHFTVYFAPVVNGKPQAQLPPDNAAKGLPESTPGQYRYDEKTGQLARGDQDRAAQESQGLICDRTIEHLGVSDKGVIMLRKLYKDSMDAIAAGGDPFGTIRDAAKNRIVEITPGEFRID
jgi:5,5'-dehydrodivanillate O-demethylase